MQRLRRLATEQRQSPWLDNLTRALLSTGRLGELIDAGIRGLTSNPTIFQKAIQGSSDYDDQFSRLVASGSPSRSVASGMLSCMRAASS